MHVIEGEMQDDLEKQAKKTAKAIKLYREAKFSTCDEVESIEDLVYYLLGKTGWEGNIDLYQDTTVLLLKLLSLPEMGPVCRKHFKENERTDIARLLYSLYDFFKDLNCEQHRTSFELKYVEYHFADDSLKSLINLEQDYTSRLNAYKVSLGGNIG